MELPTVSASGATPVGTVCTREHKTPDSKQIIVRLLSHRYAHVNIITTEILDVKRRLEFYFKENSAFTASPQHSHDSAMPSYDTPKEPDTPSGAFK